MAADAYECCGRPCSTPFCPLCGKRRGDGLHGLLAYCRENEKQYVEHARNLRLRVERNRGRTEVDLAIRDCLQTGAASVSADAARWRAWADALEALLKRPEAGA